MLPVTSRNAPPKLIGTSRELGCFDKFIVNVSLRGRRDLPPDDLEKPYPIDFQIFKNDRRYPPLLIVALAASNDQNVVRDEESICKLAEDFSAGGCQNLKMLADKGLPGMMHLAIAEI